MEGRGRRGNGGGGLKKLNGGSGGPQPQVGYSEERLRGRVFLQGPGSASKFFEFISGHSKLIGEKYYSEVRSGVEIVKKSRVDVDNLTDSLRSGADADDDVEIKEVEKTRGELFREKAKALLKMDLEEEHEARKRSNAVMNVVHGLVETANRSVHRQLVSLIGESTIADMNDCVERRKALIAVVDNVKSYSKGEKRTILDEERRKVISFRRSSVSQVGVLVSKSLDLNKLRAAYEVDAAPDDELASMLLEIA